MTAESPPIFSVVPFTDAESLAPPDKGPYYVATRKGYMIHSRTHFGRVLVPASEASSLPETNPIFFHDITKFDAALIGMAWNFFRNVWEQKKSEAMVDITYSPEKGYRLFVPPQEATAGGVKCNRNLEHYKGQIIGTIHSHCNFSAYHSGTDKHDADDHDGIHFTIGKVDQAQPEVAVMFSASKIQWDLKLEQVMIGELELVPSPEWWVKQVSDPKPTYTGITKYQPKTSTPTKTTPSKITGFPGMTRKPYQSKAKKFYDLNELMYVDSGLSLQDIEVLFDAEDMLRTAEQLLRSLDIDMEIEFEQAADSKRKDFFSDDTKDTPASDYSGLIGGIYDPDDYDWRS